MILFACLALGLVVAPVAPASAAISRTETGRTGQNEILRFHSSSPLTLQRSFALANPPRLVIDLNHLAHGNGVTLDGTQPMNAVRAVRFGQFSPQTSRIVVDLASASTSYQISMAAQAITITFASSATTEPPANMAPITSPTYSDGGGFSPMPMDKPLLAAREAQKPVIVIDAGHGGKDTGAIGRSGTIEKEVTLAYARALRHALLRTGKYQVVMTRDDDRYLFLPERVEVARRQKGDLFISMHADSNPNPAAVGLSVYTLSEQASDAEAAALATQENKSDIIGGMDLSVEDKAVAGILIDLAQRETTNKSSALAEMIISTMNPKVPLLKNPHRFAGFRVLKAPDIPSVLLEVGFLSNRADESRLQSREYQDKVVQSIARAINSYFAD